MSKSFVTGLIIALVLVLTLGGTANAAVSQSDYDMLKTKIAAGEHLSRSDINKIIDLHDAGMSVVDDWELSQLKEYGRIGERPIPARPPHNALDEYVYSTTTYSWFDISGMGTEHPLADDSATVVTLPFSFPFYGTNYTTVLIGSNGYLELGGTGTSSTLTNTALPTAATPNKLIAMFWDDLDPDRGNDGTIYSYYDAANSRFVVQFEAVDHFSPAENPETFQCFLYLNGNIVLQYNTVSNATNCTVGIENATGTEGVQVCFNATGVDCPTNGLAILINQPDGMPNPVTNVTAVQNGTNVDLSWTNPTHDTNGNPITPGAIQVWSGAPGVGTLLATLGGTVHAYTHVDAPSGNVTYYVRAYLNPYYGQAGSDNIIVGNPSYNEDFNASTGMWVVSSGEAWEWGAPTPPPAPHSAPNLWGTYFGEGYTDDSLDATLDLPIGLTINSATSAIEFWAWWEMETGYDGCNMKISTDGGNTWTVLAPTGGYPDTISTSFESAIAGEAAWTGSLDPQWTYVVIPLAAYVGQSPIFRFHFATDNAVSGYAGFYFDDMVIWGLSAAEYAPISGTISLDGGAGSVTAAVVHADGLGNPSATPAANGTYSMAQVLVGPRTVWATLAGYHNATTNVTVPLGGSTNVNLTLVRLDPPVPAGLEASVNNATGIVTLTWTTSTDPLVDQYNIYRKLQADENFVLIGNDAASPYEDDLNVPGSGIYQYAISAVDAGVSTPVESELTDPITVLYGELPPSGLAANGNFDSKIVLDWFEPGTPPAFEIYYDDGTTEDAVGLNIDGWFFTKFATVAGPSTVTAIKMYVGDTMIEGDAAQLGVFEDDGGIPAVDPIAVIDITHTAPFDGFVEWPISATIPSGAFHIGYHQTAHHTTYFPLGLDTTTPFINETFGFREDETGTYTFMETAGLPEVMMLRCFASGQFAAVTASVLQPVEITPLVAAKVDSKSKNVGSKTSSQTVSALSSQSSLSYRELAALGASAVAAHGPNVAVPTNRSHGRSLDDVLYYIVYRRPAGTGTFTDIGHPTTEHFENTGLAENISYDYYVTAYYDNNEESTPTETVTKACNMAPAAPTVLAGVASPPSGMFLTWTNPTTNDDGTPCVDLAGVQIFRSDVLVGTVAAGVTQYTDNPPENNQFYTWTVKAIDEVPNASDPSAGYTGAVVSPWQVVDYEWVDISGTGSIAAVDDDGAAGPFNLGFNFEFFGDTYSSVNICSNGFVTFDALDSTFTNTTLPNAMVPNGAIYPFWDDLNPAAAGQVYYLADAANDRFIIAWEGVPQFGTENFETFQVIISSSGSVRLNYQTIVANTTCTVGVENADGTDGILICFDGQGSWLPENSSAIEFWGGPSGEIAGLVRESGTNAAIPGADITVLEVPGAIAFTGANGMYSLSVEPGTYTVTCHKQGYCDVVNTNVIVEDNNTTTRNFSMLQPAGAVSATSINIQTQPNVNYSEQFTITNPGAGCPFEFNISANQTWLSFEPSTGEVAPNGSQTITVNATVTGMAEGVYNATVTIDHNDTDSPVEIPAILEITTTAADDPHALPTEFAFFQNYPNPFNATTALSFDVPVEANVEIAIFNVMGQEVARPVNGHYPAGHHKIMYTADGLPSGMYLVKMSAGDFSGLQKMVLLK